MGQGAMLLVGLGRAQERKASWTSKADSQRGKGFSPAPCDVLLDNSNT